MTVSEKSWTRLMTEQEWELRLGRHTCVELTVYAVKVDEIGKERIFKKQKIKKTVANRNLPCHIHKRTEEERRGDTQRTLHLRY